MGGTLFGGFCFGDCDGEGFIPVGITDKRERYRKLAEEEATKGPGENGWYLVKCPDCKPAAALREGER